MTIIKTFSVGEGDTYYIQHSSDNFSIIDCCINDDNKNQVLKELKEKSKDKNIVRFISTHPDQDHFNGLAALDDELHLLNFYCVENEATKKDQTTDFKRYCNLRDSEKAFHIYKGCSRKWMNIGDDERGAAGLSILWPNTSNKLYKEELQAAKEGIRFNNISCIIEYSLENGVKALWMGDLETDFMESIKDEVDIPKVDVLFAPHHGRETGKVPSSWLESANPSVVVIGEAPSKDLNYYNGYNTLTQNTAGDIVFECLENIVHVYVSSEAYSVNFLTNAGGANTSLGRYIGSFDV